MHCSSAQKIFDILKIQIENTTLEKIFGEILKFAPDDISQGSKTNTASPLKLQILLVILNAVPKIRSGETMI